VRVAQVEELVSLAPVIPVVVIEDAVPLAAALVRGGGPRSR
jgi:hypothetical protein